MPLKHGDVANYGRRTHPADDPPPCCPVAIQLDLPLLDNVGGNRVLTFLEEVCARVLLDGGPGAGERLQVRRRQR